MAQRIQKIRNAHIRENCGTFFLTAESFNILTRNQDSPENRSIHYATRRSIRYRPRSTSTLLHINRALYLLPLPRAKIFSCPFAQIKLHLLTEWNNRLSSQNRFLSGSIIPSCASSYRRDNSIFRTDRYRYLCKCLAQIKMIALPRLMMYMPMLESTKCKETFEMKREQGPDLIYLRRTHWKGELFWVFGF